MKSAKLKMASPGSADEASPQVNPHPIRDTKTSPVGLKGFARLSKAEAVANASRAGKTATGRHVFTKEEAVRAAEARWKDSNAEPVECPIHHNMVTPLWSKRHKKWFVICNAAFPKTHFITHPNDESSLTNYFDHYDEIERRKSD